MKKTLIVAVGLAALGVAYWLISPLFIDKRVSEEFPTNGDATVSTELSQIKQQGSFEGFDRIHYGSGDVVVIETEGGYVVRFEENFEVANGPDLYVGSQNYMVPESIDLEQYNEVWVWCRAFSVGFAKARLIEV